MVHRRPPRGFGKRDATATREGTLQRKNKVCLFPIVRSLAKPSTSSEFRVRVVVERKRLKSPKLFRVPILLARLEQSSTHRLVRHVELLRRASL